MHLLFALILSACFPKPTLKAVELEGVFFGWRLAPGMELTYRLTSIHTLNDVKIKRIEVWSYLVRSSNIDGFTLEAKPCSVDAIIQQKDQTLDQRHLRQAIQNEYLRLNSDHPDFTLSLNGNMDNPTFQTWSDSLPHRLLALTLPEKSIVPGDRWNDTSSARPYTQLIPSGVDIAVSGTNRLIALIDADHEKFFKSRPHVDALIETDAIVNSHDARFPSLEIQSQVTWDLSIGMMEKRLLTVKERGGIATGEPGNFELSLELLDDYDSCW